MVPEKSSDFEALLVRKLQASGASAFIFDLDNTVYWEHLYVRSALREVRWEFQDKVGTEVSTHLASRIWQLYCAEKTRRMFQVALAELRLPVAASQNIVEIFENHTVPGGLGIRHWAQTLIPETSVPVGILTNGNPITQKNKLRNLRPKDLVSSLSTIYANEIEPKPSPLGVMNFAKLWSVQPSEIVLVGDSRVDKYSAKAAGCQFIRSVCAKERPLYGALDH